MKYLIDASALYGIVARGKTLPLTDIAVLTLTPYEVGNVIWKEQKRNKIKEIEFVVSAFADFFNAISKLDTDFDGAETIAIERNLSFYDSAYVYVAEKNNLFLVTEDKELLKKSKASITTEKFLQMV